MQLGINWKSKVWSCQTNKKEHFYSEILFKKDKKYEIVKIQLNEKMGSTHSR